MDYPKFYGDSHPSINDFAHAAVSIMKGLCGDKVVSLLGFHTGCLVAVETSLISTTLFNEIILIDVPYFSEDTQKDLLSRRVGYFSISRDLSDLQAAWDRSVSRQKSNMSTDRSFEMFVDHISAGPTAGDPFTAAFTYNCAAQFPKVILPCTVIATKAGLYDESIFAAKAIRHSAVIKAPHIKVSVLEACAEETARLVRQCTAH